MFWNKDISSLENWFIGIFIAIYFVYFVKVIYLSYQLKISAKASFLKFLPRLILFALLIIALLEPSFGNFENKSLVNSTNKVIYFLVDVSQSMNAKDIAPTRLEKVKNEIKKIVDYFPNDRFGIITFASDAYLHCTLTSDEKILKDLISSINTNYFSVSGTNLEGAFSLFFEKFKSNYNFSETSSASVLLFTDGEDFSDIKEQSLNEFKRKNINLFVVGVGTKKGFELLDNKGINVKNSNEKIVRTKLESEYLKQISAKTNGRYFEFNGFNEPANQIIEQITQLKGVAGLRSFDSANAGNKYHYPLLLAFLLICIDLLVPIQIFNFNKS